MQAERLNELVVELAATKLELLDTQVRPLCSHCSLFAVAVLTLLSVHYSRCSLLAVAVLTLLSARSVLVRGASGGG